MHVPRVVATAQAAAWYALVPTVGFSVPVSFVITTNGQHAALAAKKGKLVISNVGGDVVPVSYYVPITNGGPAPPSSANPTLQ